MNEHRVPALEPDALATLRNLVERMDQHRDPWGIEKGGEPTGPHSFTMPYLETHELAREAMMFLYDNDLIVQFAWPTWDEGRAIFRGPGKARFSSLDQMTVLKLLTAVARNDRFNDGAWVGLFEDGSAQALFRRLLEIETGDGR